MDEEITFRSDMKVEMMDFMGTDETIIKSAKISTAKDETVGAMSDEVKKKFINFLAEGRHGSPFEHVVFTFRIEAPIFVFRELFRHRIASPNEMSARYTEMKPVFYEPDNQRPIVQVGKPGQYTFEHGSPRQELDVSLYHQAAYTEAWFCYSRMLENGLAREVARSVLPVGIYSEAYFTINLRSLTNLLSLRTEERTHSTYPSYPQYEIARVADKMEKYMQMVVPIAYSAWNTNGRVGL